MNNIKSYSKEYNNFTSAIMAKYLKEKNNENIVFSPFSILMMLCIAADMTLGKTHDEIVSALSSDIKYDELKKLLCEIQTKLTEKDSVSSANALYVKEKLSKKVISSFVSYLNDKYSCKYVESAESDFVSDINNWVTDKTHGMIDEIVDDSMKDALLCLMNATAFEAEWKEEYEEDDIYEELFESSDGVEKEVDMLHSEETWYIETEDLKGFVKPYKKSDYSFMALLPNKKSKKALLELAQNCDYTDLFNIKTNTEVYTALPEFNCDFDSELKPTLKKFGINEMFSDDADFSPFTSEWIKVESVKHKAHIEVDRKGTKASAVSAMIGFVGCACVMIKPFVELTRPFVYAIMHNETGLPVFVGVVNKL